VRKSGAAPLGDVFTQRLRDALRNFRALQSSLFPSRVRASAKVRTSAIAVEDAAVDCQIYFSLEPHIRTADRRENTDVAHARGYPVSAMMRQVREHSMRKNAASYLALLFIAIASLGPGGSGVSAADDCITASNLAPPKGTRWQYRIDGATGRTCWRIVASALHTGRAPELSQTGQKDRRRLSDSRQAALFSEFLRWKDRQDTVQRDTTDPSRPINSP
jgi:hypothetical protein